MKEDDKVTTDHGEKDFMLGFSYYMGYDVPQDYARAAKYLKKAAK